MRRPLRTSGEVARWAAQRTHELGEAQVLWVRVVNGGPGWVLTPEGEQPRGGSGWRPVLVLQAEVAAAIAAGGYNAWLWLSRLAEDVEAARGG